ncbi:MAG: hypothetical protein ABI787_12310 [Spartobacteria bacterium]
MIFLEDFLAFATGFFFALGLGGRPRFFGACAAAFRGFSCREEVFDFLAKTVSNYA